MNSQPYMFALVVIAATIAYVVYGLVRNRKSSEIWEMIKAAVPPRVPLAEWSIKPEVPFLYSHNATAAASVRLFLKTDITYYWRGAEDGDDERAFGLSIQIGVASNKESNHRLIQMGIGDMIKPGFTPFRGIMHRTGFSRRGNLCRFRATIPLASIQTRQEDNQISLQGKISASNNIESSDLRLFISR